MKTLLGENEFSANTSWDTGWSPGSPWRLPQAYNIGGTPLSYKRGTGGDREFRMIRQKSLNYQIAELRFEVGSVQFRNTSPCSEAGHSSGATPREEPRRGREKARPRQTPSPKARESGLRKKSGIKRSWELRPGKPRPHTCAGPPRCALLYATLLDLVFKESFRRRAAETPANNEGSPGRGHLSARAPPPPVPIWYVWVPRPAQGRCVHLTESGERNPLRSLVIGKGCQLLSDLSSTNKSK